jgi:hypothetical protein
VKSNSGSSGAGLDTPGYRCKPTGIRDFRQPFFWGQAQNARNVVEHVGPKHRPHGERGIEVETGSGQQPSERLPRWTRLTKLDAGYDGLCRFGAAREFALG